MARKATAAPAGSAKEDARPEAGEIDAGGELVRTEQPAITVVHAEPTTDAKKVDSELDKRLADLEKELASNKRRVEDAERRATEAEALAAKNAGTAQNNQDAALRNYETSVTNAIAASKAELAASKKAFAAAMEAGDFVAAADAQEALTAAKRNELHYENESRNIEEYKKQPKAEQPEQRAQPQRPRDAVDVRQMPHQARDYLDDHPEYLDDWRLWNKLGRAHADAIDDGVDPYSDEYFQLLDGRMGNRRHDEPRREARREAPKRERRQSADDGALPPSRENPGGGTRSATEVTLSQREAEAAHFSFPELSHREAEVAYAEQKVKLQSEGRIGTKH